MRAKRIAPLLAVLIAMVLGALHMAFYRGVPGDFRRYHRAGRMVVTGDTPRLYDEAWLAGKHVYEEERREDRARRGDKADPYPEEEFKYLPATAVLLAPLGALKLYAAKVWWGGWNAALIALLFVVLAEACSGGRAIGWIAVPVLLLANVANANLMLGQLNPTAIVPATLGLVLLSRRKDVPAGFLIGFAAVVKFMPVVLAIYLAWKRRWTALAAMTATLLLVGWGLPAVVLGPAEATARTVEYFHVRSSTYTTATPPELPGHSIKSFLYRTLGAMRLAGDPDSRMPDVAVAHLPSEWLYRLSLAATLLLLGVVLRTTRGPLRAPDDRRGLLEAGAFLAFLLLASPEARAPHFLYLALPLTALIYAFVDSAGGGHPAPLPAPTGIRARVRAAGHAVAMSSRAWKLALGLTTFAALLLQTSPPTFVGRMWNGRLTAVCSLGWAAGALLVATAMRLRALRAAAAPTRDGP